MADREDEGTAPHEEEPAGAPPHEEEPPAAPLDEEAAWAALVAGYDDEPEPGAALWPEAENVPAPGAEPDPTDPAAVSTKPPASDRTIVIHPVIRGPRDYELADDDEDAHYVPPEPPPLPEADVTTKFAWIAVLGGPLLLLVFVLFQLEITWWAATLGVGGFLGGFATLVMRMRTGEDDEDDDPGRGAVV
ncbi:hypothetical protein [Actinacidiphila epipremni]|uniref:DUF308 domain-containing protein n=1 Tax=Actinacidiphila epipremni TaxID=2053013 RepID=A0ABX0ZQH3_9ACTN|nr:hypothetical protein [Actinacidiphila epipremni]